MYKAEFLVSVFYPRDTTERGLTSFLSFQEIRAEFGQSQKVITARPPTFLTVSDRNRLNFPGTDDTGSVLMKQNRNSQYGRMCDGRQQAPAGLLCGEFSTRPCQGAKYTMRFFQVMR